MIKKIFLTALLLCCVSSAECAVVRIDDSALEARDRAYITQSLYGSDIQRELSTGIQQSAPADNYEISDTSTHVANVLLSAQEESPIEVHSFLDEMQFDESASFKMDDSTKERINAKYQMVSTGGTGKVAKTDNGIVASAVELAEMGGVNFDAIEAMPENTANLLRVLTAAGLTVVTVAVSPSTAFAEEKQKKA